jgi:seryl-tRNA(Sec) selenium transferase
MRALRAGKESYAVIAETLRAFATERHEEEIRSTGCSPTPLDALRARAEELDPRHRCRVVDSDCALGGGTTPTEKRSPSIAIVHVDVPAGGGSRAGRRGELTFARAQVPRGASR